MRRGGFAGYAAAHGGGSASQSLWNCLNFGEKTTDFMG